MQKNLKVHNLKLLKNLVDIWWRIDWHDRLRHDDCLYVLLDRLHDYGFFLHGSHLFLDSWWIVVSSSSSTPPSAMSNRRHDDGF